MSDCPNIDCLKLASDFRRIREHCSYAIEQHNEEIKKRKEAESEILKLTRDAKRMERADNEIEHLNKEVQILKEYVRSLKCLQVEAKLEANSHVPKESVCKICNNIDYQAISWKQEVARNKEALQFRTKLIHKDEEIKALKEKIQSLEAKY